MKTIESALLKVLPVVAVIVGLCLLGQPARAQNSSNSPSTTAAQTQQQPTEQPDEQQSAAAAKTFTGKIAKAGEKFVLTDAQGKTYLLDDQQKAQDFVNKNVKVTGVLDAPTDTIRVSAIDPA